jgi:hypothetical protein
VWEAKFSSPSLSCSKEDADKIVIAQMQLLDLAESEIQRRKQMSQMDKEGDKVPDQHPWPNTSSSPAPG